MQSIQESKAVLTAAEQQVARLERDGITVATGFLVGPALLLTAGHAVALSLGASGAEPVRGMTAVFDHRDGTGWSSAGGWERVRLAELLDSSPPAANDPVPEGMRTAEDGLDFAFVRLAGHPSPVRDAHGVLRPRGYYRLSDEEFVFTAEGLYLFHYSQRVTPDHAQTQRTRLGEDGRRVRYRGANTLDGASGSPLVTRAGRVVALHHGHNGGWNQGVPAALIAERILAGPHAGSLRGALDAPPLPSHADTFRAVAAPAGDGSAAVRGATAVGEAMGALLGPHRPHATVPGPDGEPVRAADARQVAGYFRDAGPGQALGIGPVVEAARTMAASAGDGAVTAAVLAAALIRETAGHLGTDTAPRDIIRQATEAGDVARAALAAMTVPCPRPDGVARSATADRELAEAVSAAALLAGPDGVLVCEPGATRDVERPVPGHGLRLPAGNAFPYTADTPETDPWTRHIRLVRPYVLLLDPVTGDGEAFRRLRGRLAAEGSPLLVLTTADASDPRAGLLRSLGDPADGPVPTVVRVPVGPGRLDPLRALAVLTGATALTADSRVLPGAAWFDVLGRAELAVVSGSETVLVGGHHDPAALRRWIASTRELRSLTDSGAERAALDAHLAWLTSRAVTLAIGADTAADLVPRTAAAARVAHAAQAALRSGTLPGGGLALLRARAALPPGSEAPGTHAVRAALATPFRVLAARTGLGRDEVERLCAVADPELLAGERPFRAPDGGEPEDAAETVLLALDAALAALTAFLGTVGTVGTG
ncbi:trypsin-like peptidase domain-containing protein [Streptomyces sp. LP11]|uniref:Trypsin-like peptidase domain-containing protein n=1 Tax=Streptomyces pyxinicus TaxID=2970331 RepID=A0ABT2B5B4_9ACTN|nr:trypsin-like peptidase domain-containing protein [Streptomyces sp. LP11]MCS0603716.1 trypsin-like peptidase domain-containing protein [Streptomyces sp. LP11]